jgi:uncharacterized membrane-anchored protein YhcB (DUF1043 family)
MPPDGTLLWVIGAGALALIAGIAVGYALRGRVAREREAELRGEASVVRDRYDVHRRRVTEHFSRCSDLFRDLTRSHAALYAHLAKGAREFCPEATPSLGAEVRLLLSEGDSGTAGSHAAMESSAGGGSRLAAGQTVVLDAAAPTDASDGPVADTAPAVAAAMSRGAGERELAASSPLQPTSHFLPAAAAGGVVESESQTAPATAEKPIDEHANEGFTAWLARLGTRKREKSASVAEDAIAEQPEESFSAWYERMRARKREMSDSAPFQSGYECTRAGGESNGRCASGERSRHSLRDELHDRSAADAARSRGGERVASAA